MKLLVLHGPAIQISRKKLTEIRQKFDPGNVVVFEKSADIRDIQAALSTDSLFSENRLVILENPPEDIDLALSTYHLSLILWFDHEIKTKYPGEIHFFPEAKEVSVFPFLDLLGNRDKKAFLELDKLKRAGLPAGRQGFDTQYFITMIFYLLRNLVATPKNAHDFVKKKNARMRANFSPEELIKLYKFIIETDFKIKKGLLETQQAEFLLVNKFLHNVA
mgnify:CR=1 FL=1